MPTQILIVNQHGDNRGDEAAMRGMVNALRDRVPGAEFCILHQFRSPASAVDLAGVRYLPLKLPAVEVARLATWAAGARAGVQADTILGRQGREIVEAYRAAALVVSAPGGPYFGDVYADHEVVHWFYVWLATVFDRPLALYQPSAGPFTNRALNPIRRRGFRWFGDVSVRESTSADLLEAFTGRRPFLGSDSALEDVIDPLAADDPLAPPAGTAMVTATFRDPGDHLRPAHDRAVVDVLVRLADRGVVIRLIPQLVGDRSDHGYLSTLAARARDRGAEVTVVDKDITSDRQRALVASSEFVLSGRYHPLVFAVGACRPAVSIPYEHKARAFAHTAGLDDFVVELDELSGGALLDAVERLWSQLDETRSMLEGRAPELRARAAATADRVASMVPDPRAAAT